MVACGFDAIEDVRAPDDAITVAARSRPAAVVVDIELSGSRGIGIVTELLAAAPGAAVIVLSQFDRLRFPALEAGAYSFVAKADLRELQRCLTRLAGDKVSRLPTEVDQNGRA